MKVTQLTNQYLSVKLRDIKVIKGGNESTKGLNEGRPAFSTESWARSLLQLCATSEKQQKQHLKVMPLQNRTTKD